MAKRLPTPVENEHELPENQAMKAAMIPTTLQAAIRMFPQFKVLTEDQQEISVAIEIEGVLHNRTTLPSMTVDVIFVVDNGYVLVKLALLELVI